MANRLELRIMQNRPSGWYWEVVTQDREVIARGVTATHESARMQALETVQAAGNLRRSA